MNAGRWVIAAGCAYELCALPDRSPLPTITELVKMAGRHPVLKFAVWTWCGAWAWHFLEPTP